VEGWCNHGCSVNWCRDSCRRCRARGLAKKFGKKTEEPRERFKSSYDKAKEAEDKIKAAAEKREKIKEGVKTTAKTTAKAAGATGGWRNLYRW
jgi:hypothetical protein